MRRATVLGAILALVASLAVATDSKTDFSGTWKENMEKGTAPKGSGTTSYMNKIEQKGDTLKVVTTTGGSRGERTYERTYVIGKEDKHTGSDGDEFTSITKWEGKSLVFETSEKERGGTITSRETWTLSDDGKTLTKTRHSHGPQGDRDQTYVLEKQ